MSLRDYQIAPVAYLATRKRALVSAPAGSGKTIMAATAVRTVVERKERNSVPVIGWIANTREQVQQAYKAMVQVFTGEDVDVNVAEWKWNAYEPVAPITFKAACAAAGCTWSLCDLLIVDECHHAPAPEWNWQIETCKGARWGFTATPEAEGEDAEERNATMRELFGDEWYFVERKDVGGQIAKARVVLLDPACVPGTAEKIDAECSRIYSQRIRHWGGDPQKLRAMVLWQMCVEHGIVGNKLRTLKGIQKANQHVMAGESVLVLVNQVEHAVAVAAEIKGAKACYSGMGAKARRHALYDFKQGKLKCIVATSLADEGLDVPIASVLVLISGGKSKAKAEQRTGRVLRKFAGKTQARIYDFVDSFHPLMKKHSLARQDVYYGLGYLLTQE